MPIFSGRKVLEYFIQLFTLCFGEDIGKFTSIEFNGYRYESSLKFFSESSHLIFEFQVQPRHIESERGIDFPPYAFTFSVTFSRFTEGREYVSQTCDTIKVTEYTKLCTIIHKLRDSVRETLITSGCTNISEVIRETFINRAIIPILNKKRKEYRKI